MASTARWSDKPLPVLVPDSSSNPSMAEVEGSTAPGRPTTTGRAGGGMRDWLYGGGEKTVKRLRKEFGGGRGFNGQYRYRRPQKRLNDDVEKDIMFAGNGRPSKSGEYAYVNSLGQTIWKHQDVDTYLSATRFEPRRLIVQATPHVLKDPFLVNTDWRRRLISGDIPTALKMAEWALAPGDRDPETGRRPFFGALSRVWRIALVGIPLQFLLAFPGLGSPWEQEVDDTFLGYPGYHWKWPKHAVNPLDQRPAPSGGTKPSSKPVTAASRSRLNRPRRLVVHRGDERWSIEENPDPAMQYIFVSFTTQHFNTNAASDDGRREIMKMAAHVTLALRCRAFWIDYQCCAPADQPQEKTADINCICDVIRSAKMIVVMLPDQRGKPQPKSQEELLREWGRRMWTLPEGLLAPGQLHFCAAQADGSYGMFELHKTELTDRVWQDYSTEAGDPPTRLLAEHYDGTLTLSRLEFFSTALQALCDREATNLYTDADLAYCLMGLLRYRIEPDASDSLFQALARLSLANDSDRLIERMICMYPKGYGSFRRLFEFLTKPDQYETHLWDIHPMCEVVGVGDEPNTVIINGCKAIPIRWKEFPRMKYARHEGFKKLFAEMFVRSGAWWFIAGISLAYTYAPFLLAYAEDFSPSADASTTTGGGGTVGSSTVNLTRYLVILMGAFVAMGFLLSAMGPHAVRRLFGGAVLQTSPHLVGFEGVLPIRQLEKLMFGNCSGRLSYEASSTPFILHHRHPERREGIEPPWIRHDPGKPDIGIPAGQRLFTLVDTNNLAVSVFTAQRPPTVALICGREGGMLRTVLCSWRFSMDCLFREAVVRLPHDTWDIAKMPSWLKLSLGNQEDMLDGIRWQQNELWRQRASGGASTAFSPKSKPISLSKPPVASHHTSLSKPPAASHHTSLASAQTFSPPPHKPKPISPPVSAFSPQARQRASAHRTSSAPSPLKTSTSATTTIAHPPPAAAAAQSSAIHSPSPKPLQHAATYAAASPSPHEPTFHTPPATFAAYRPPTFLAPITPTAPLSAPPSPAPSNPPLPPGVSSPAPAGGAQPSPYVASATEPPYPLPPPGGPADSADVSPYASTRHDSSRTESASPRRDAHEVPGDDVPAPTPAPADRAAGRDQGWGDARSRSPANLPELLRPAAPSRERSSPALEPGRVRGGDERYVPAAELEGSSRQH